MVLKYGRPFPAVRRDRLSHRERLVRFLRVEPLSVTLLPLLGIALMAAAGVSAWLRIPFGYSTFPLWIILAANGALAILGGVALWIAGQINT
jgi:hypothetical protein